MNAPSIPSPERPAERAAAPRLLIVTTAKDEAAYIERTIASMAAQTARPTRWIIVNDASRDATGDIAERAAAAHDWISVLHRQPQDATRRVGPGVVEAFYAGLHSVDWQSYDYLCKLDADLQFGPRYFANLFERFERNPKLGTASGKCYIPAGESFVYERTGDDFSHGVAKLYRRACFEQIGGFVPEVMWDAIDCHRCRMLGWEAASYDDPELKIHHLRQMGSSFRSVYHGRRRWGRGLYFMGSHPLYMAAVTAYRLAERPWILGGLCIGWGYLQAWLSGSPRYADAEFRRHLHRWQWDQLRRRLQ